MFARIDRRWFRDRRMSSGIITDPRGTKVDQSSPEIWESLHSHSDDNVVISEAGMQISGFLSVHATPIEWNVDRERFQQKETQRTRVVKYTSRIFTEDRETVRSS